MGRSRRILVVAAVALIAAAASAPAASADVVLNEISCDDNDWIEVKNTDLVNPVDISGWILTDAALSGGGDPWPFPAATSVPANGFLAIDRDLTETTGFAFGINCADTIRLGENTTTLVDEESLPNFDFDLDTWGRIPDGSGNFEQTFPTKSAANTPSPSGVDQAAWLYDRTKVMDIDLTLPQTSIDDLAEDPTDYVEGAFTLTDGPTTYGPLDVGIRLKGSTGSFRLLTGKAAFKIRFPFEIPGQRFAGLKTLTLNNMVQDHSMVHETLAYEASRALGIAAPRNGFAFVSVNGADYGVYLNLETLDDVSLPLSYPTTQHLYEGELGTDVLPGGAADFEVDEGTEGTGASVADLTALIDAVNGTVPADFSDRVAGVADLQQMTLVWALEKYIGHLDGYTGVEEQPNNYYLHSDASGVFSMVPSGTDQTWGHHSDFGSTISGELFKRCLGDPSCAAMYRAAVQQARNTIAALNLDGLATSTASLLAPWQAIDPRKEQTQQEIDAALAATRAFIAERPGEADAWLDLQAFLQGPVHAATAGSIRNRKTCPKGKRLKGGRCVAKKRRKSRAA